MYAPKLVQPAGPEAVGVRMTANADPCVAPPLRSTNTDPVVPLLGADTTIHPDMSGVLSKLGLVTGPSVAGTVRSSNAVTTNLGARATGRRRMVRPLRVPVRIALRS